MKPRTPLKRGPAPKRKVRPKASNPARKAREFARAYGSKARVAFVNSLPCLCGADHLNVISVAKLSLYWRGENAHVPSQSGAGRKGDYTKIVPLCAWHHRLSAASLHALGKEGFERAWSVDLDAECARVQQLFEASQGEHV